MTEDQLRQLVREAVSRHLGGPAPAALTPAPNRVLVAESSGRHPSHIQYMTLVNAGDACLIEPSVECNHCGYCRCHGH